MSLEKARAWLGQYGMAERIQTFEASSATVELAAEALHCEPGRIAKTLSFVVNDQVVLLVTAGDVRIDNAKYKTQFGTKAKMVRAEDAEQLIGHAVGGVCPFGVKPGISVYLDVSLQKYPTVYPACGDSHSAIELSCAELERCSESKAWVDVCKASA